MSTEHTAEKAGVRCPFERDDCDRPECFSDVDECSTAAFTASVDRVMSDRTEKDAPLDARRLRRWAEGFEPGASMTVSRDLVLRLLDGYGVSENSTSPRQAADQ